MFKSDYNLFMGNVNNDAIQMKMMGYQEKELDDVMIQVRVVFGADQNHRFLWSGRLTWRMYT